MYETGAPPPPPPLPVDVPLVVDHADHGRPSDPAARPGPAPSAATSGWESVVAVLPAGPPPGTTTYRLRATETAQDGGPTAD